MAAASVQSIHKLETRGKQKLMDLTFQIWENISILNIFHTL
jgi:hypothetical protein